MSNKKKLSLWLSAGLMLVCTADLASAQCSRGGNSRGGKPSGSSGGLSMMIPSSFASARPSVAQQRYAIEQMLAMRNQIARQQLQGRYEQQQDLLAMRRARADQKRARRAERIAAMIASRNADSDSPARSGAAAALVALAPPNPFE